MTVSGLSSESGKQLNGRRGVITKMPGDTERYEVRFSKNRSAMLKPANLEQVPSQPSDSTLLEGVEGIDPDAQSPCVFQELEFKRGDAVEVSGLHSDSGRELNGKNGTILEYFEETGRYKVKFALGMVGNKYEYREVSLKPNQLVRINKNPFSKTKIKPPKAPSGPVFNRTNFGLDGAAGAQAPFQNEDPPQPQPPTYAGEFAPGELVEVHGLQSEGGRVLNGRTGSVETYVEDKDRYEVRFRPEDELKLLKAANLRRPPPGQRHGGAAGAGYV